MNHPLTFTVPGQPEPQPRPRFAFIAGRPRAYNPAGARGYKERIRLALANALVAYNAGLPPEQRFPLRYAGPVSVYIRAMFAPPKSLLRGGLLKVAPDWRTNRPDIDNVVKAVLDAITDYGLWQDDRQVVNLCAQKRHAQSPDKSETAITIIRNGNA